MPLIARMTVISLLAAIFAPPVWATEDPGMAPMGKAAPHPAEYKRSDANFYPKAEFMKERPRAVVIPLGGYSQEGDAYFFTPKIRAPKDIYFEVLSDWVESITPPDGPAALGIVVDAMQIREPQGDVTIALPSAPTNFVAVTEGMTIPNGTVIKTGANGTAAVLFGGVDSARLMPNSEAAVQQTVTAQSHMAEVDLTAGGVFSKVGTQVGVKGDYAVHTPFGNAGAQGGDFVTLACEAKTPHVEVWVAQGTVELSQTDGTKLGEVSSGGTGPLRVLRSVANDTGSLAHGEQELILGEQELTEILNFVPLANQKTKALREKSAQGLTLSANEEAYLKRVREIPSLIKLTLVAPPVSAQVPVAPAMVARPAATGTTSPVPLPSATPGAMPGQTAPIRAVVRVDGKINFEGATYDLPGFKAKLTKVAKATPDQAIVVRAGKSVPYENVEPVFDICRELSVKYTSTIAPKSALSNPETAPAESAGSNLPSPALLLHPSMAPAPRAPSPSPTNEPAAAGP